MKKCKVQEKSDNEDKGKGQSFDDDLKQAWYKRSPM